jgi:WhiB family transcriptional regulator, redox-sensing transcriptional regulator
MTDTQPKWPVIPGGIPPFADHPDRACADHPDPNLWFPEGGSNGAPAKAVCRTCPLIDACAAFAIPQPRLWGVWGGLNDEDRRQLRRRKMPETIRGSWARTAADRDRVAELVALGVGSVEISRRIGISRRTVQRHVNALGRSGGHPAVAA